MISYKNQFLPYLYMARQVNHLSDIPDSRKFGSKYGGRRYKRHDWSWGRGAKSRLKSKGKRLKRQGRISSYRIVSYKNVAVTKEKSGRVGNRRRKVHVLYVRK